MKTCFLFPGQGAQYSGMAKDLWEASEKVKDLFSLASDSTGMDLKKLLFEGSEEELKATDKTQVAVTLASVAASIILKEKSIEPDACAGFSLGEYSALYEAGVIRLEDLFPIVKARGELMEKASRNLDSAGGSAGMAAAIGLSYQEASEALDALKELEGEKDNSQVFLANYTSPKQIVLAGTAEGLNRAESIFKSAGARRYIRLRVSGPFHSPLLEEARAGVQDVLSEYEFSDPVKPVYANVSGKRTISGSEARELCIRQVVSTVHWVDEEQSLISDGLKRFLEVGPGTVLCGLWKSFSKEYPCLPAGKLEDISKLQEGYQPWD